MNKCPLIFIVNHEKLTNTLNIFNKYKVDKKRVINKLYKVLAINMDLLTDNINVIKKHFDINEYLANDNYNLLKIVNLDKKIEYIKNKYAVTSYEDVYEHIVKEVYDNKDKYVWGDENA